jgi:hypothetical protein
LAATLLPTPSSYRVLVVYMTPLALLLLFFAVFIGVLFFCCFYLFGTLCGCCSWGIHSNSSHLDCFVCAADFLRVHSVAHRQLSGLFLCPYHDELPTPPSALVSSLHAIGSLPAAVIRVVCVCVCVCFFFFFFFFSRTFSFLFLLVIRLYPLSLIYPVLLWSRPWVVDVNDFLTFGLRMMSFWHENFALRDEE